MPGWLKTILIIIAAVVALKVVGAIAFSLIGMLFTIAVLGAVGFGVYYLASGGNKRLPPR